MSCISSAPSHSASSSGFPIVALSPIICTFFNSFFNTVINISSVGPLLTSLSMCISSIITVFTNASHGAVCLIRESSFSAVQIMRSLSARYGSALSLSPMLKATLQKCPYFLLKSLYFSLASATSGTM